MIGASSGWIFFDEKETDFAVASTSSEAKRFQPQCPP